MPKKDRLWGVIAVVYLILAVLVVGYLDFQQLVAEQEHSIYAVQMQGRD